MSAERALPWRVITLWQQIDGDVLFTNEPTLLSAAEMANPTPNSGLGQFVDFLAENGFNALGLRYYTDEHRPVLASFARYLKGKGLRLLICHQWTELENGGLEWLPLRSADLRRTSPLLCPFSPDVRRFWQDQMNKDFQDIPDLGGYTFDITTEYFMSNGAPWMCDCAQCSAVSRRDRLIAALRFLGKLLARHDGILLWNNHQDDPWGQQTEIELFSDLTGQVPDNVLIMFSDLYWDQEPGWQRNPMCEYLKPPASGRPPYLVRIQLPGQYRGMHLFPASMVEDWAQTFRDIRQFGLSGVWVQAFINRTEWDHPWNLAHWYAIGRYASDPDTSPQAILNDWAKQTYGGEASGAVVEILQLSYRASIKVFMCEGLMASAKSQMASLLYLDSHLCGPLRETPRVPGHIGANFPLGLYPPNRARQIKANPMTRLLFSSESITPQVKARALAEKDEAIRLIDRMIELWESVSGKVDPVVHETLLARLQGNRVDAEVFKAALDLYFDWKLGALTGARIDQVVADFGGQHGQIVLDPAGPIPTDRRSAEDDITRNLRSFGEELRRDLHQPWVDDYFNANPLSSGVVPEEAEEEM